MIRVHSRLLPGAVLVSVGLFFLLAGPTEDGAAATTSVAARSIIDNPDPLESRSPVGLTTCGGDVDVRARTWIETA